jgi:hypothetical protein
LLSPRAMRIIEDLVNDWRRPDERIEGLSADIISLMEKNPACERLMTVPGIGPIISSAMVAATGGRDLFSAAGISLPGRGWRRGRSSRTLGFERSSDISFQRRAASQWQVLSSSRAGGSKRWFSKPFQRSSDHRRDVGPACCTAITRTKASWA